MPRAPHLGAGPERPRPGHAGTPAARPAAVLPRPDQRIRPSSSAPRQWSASLSWCFPRGDSTFVSQVFPRAVPKVLAPRVGLVTQGRAAVAEDGNTTSARMSCMTYIAAEDRYESMTYRRVGRSGVKLPLISLGLWHNFGDDRSLDTQRAILRRAFDLGVCHIDLANNYGPPYGSAETNFGTILRQDLL